MAHPRHARRRRGPIVAVVVLVAALVAVAAVAAVRLWPQTDLQATTSTSDGSSSTQRSASSDSSASAGPTSASTDPNAAKSAEAAAARKTLNTCITRVRSTDEVLNQAAIGIHNWSMHVKAQNDADMGKISVARMNRTFKKTKLEGPDDIERYQKAKKDRQPVGDACRDQAGANAVVTSKLNSCQKRITAQEAALPKAEAAMNDWAQHLSDMKRSAAGEVSGKQAEQTWVTTYRKAPKHLDPYDKAANAVNSAPTCT